MQNPPFSDPRAAIESDAAADAGALFVELAARYFDHFEPPTESEGPLRVVRT